MLVQRLLFVVVAFSIGQFAQAQPTVCTYSCPDTNAIGQALLHRILAIPYESDYSVFQCVYGEVNANPKTQSCFYNKANGKHALGHEKDGCPAQATPCSSGAEDLFSSPGHPEVPAWIENGRYLLYLKENHT
ncbi:hypothetical protein D9756_008778 [Leucocoprinus leucothites]|uniref:Secreted protein n=1 Tax=Leucocoprinus leucothites TaxID=201217 RepID=A0A8H5CYG5_9AGAR|nr:hypothetical protein D9756_008778 [Leucoagaricus leucothites]